MFIFVFINSLEKYKCIQLVRPQTEMGKQMLKRRREDIEPELGLFSIAHNFKKLKNGVQRLIEWQDDKQKTLELGTVLGYLTA